MATTDPLFHRYASYERTSSRLTVPLAHGAGSLTCVLTAAWLKKSTIDEEDEDLDSVRVAAL